MCRTLAPVSIHTSSEMLTGGASVRRLPPKSLPTLSAPQYTGNSQFYRKGQLKTHICPTPTVPLRREQRERETETHVLQNKGDSKKVGSVWERQNIQAEVKHRAIRWKRRREKTFLPGGSLHKNYFSLHNIITDSQCQLLFAILPTNRETPIPCKHPAKCRLSHTGRVTAGIKKSQWGNFSACINSAVRQTDSM